MGDKDQKLKTVLIPEEGIILEPPYSMESDVSTNFLRALVHLVAQSPNGPIMLRATSGGDIRVSSSGIAYEYYDVNAGNAPDAFDAPNTFLFANAQYVSDFLIETFGATVQFRDGAGAWGDSKSFPPGFFSIEMIHFGVRIQNRIPGSISVYEITTYR